MAIIFFYDKNEHCQTFLYHDQNCRVVYNSNNRVSWWPTTASSVGSCLNKATIVKHTHGFMGKEMCDIFLALCAQ